MANIGTFTKTAKGYTGEIVTMSVQQKKVRIEAETDVQNDKAPTHRVFVGRAEIGAGWVNRAASGDAARSGPMVHASPPRSTPTCSTTRTARPTT